MNVNALEGFLRKIPDHKKSMSVFEQYLPDEWAASEYCYNMQQLVEKELKAIIQLKGTDPRYSHDIAFLVSRAAEHGVFFSDVVDDISDSLSSWEMKTRYGTSFDVSENKIRKAKEAEAEIFKTLEELVVEMCPEFSDVLHSPNTRSAIKNFSDKKEQSSVGRTETTSLVETINDIKRSNSSIPSRGNGIEPR